MTSRVDWRALAELVRLPAVASVPGDVLLGAAAGQAGRRGTGRLAASSSLLYLAGMALNDYADRAVDAVERPQRPIPSGRVRPGTALGLAAGLTVGALAASTAAGGRRALSVTGPLAALVWAYDLRLKKGVTAVPAMAAARGLNVLAGATAGSLPRALPCAALVTAHTALVTGLSRREVEGTGPGFVRALRAGHVVTAGLAAAAGARHDRRWNESGGHRGGRLGRLAGVGLITGYAAENIRAQTAAVQDPAPARLQAAVGRGVLSLVLLQAGLLARWKVGQAVLVAAAWPASRLAARRRAVS